MARYLSRVVRLWQLLLEGRPRCLKRVRALVKGKQGIEIGGPSDVFRQWFNLPIYDDVGRLDNCDFSQTTTWATHAPTYRFSDRKPAGKVFIAEGSNLQEIGDNSYDFLLSSHNLEHFANPIEALREWQRILKPDGYLVLILPDYRRTFDRARKPTTVAHMWDDYAQGTGEDDKTHVDETYLGHQHTTDTSLHPEFYAHLLNNFEHRQMHHHTFDEKNSEELLKSTGMTVLSVETARPYHVILVAQGGGKAESRAAAV